MASRASLNKVLLIGNLTRDPELRYTPSGAAVCTFGVATNRVYTASDGTKKEEAEFHRIVSWNKLAELCSQLLTKGRKVFVEGRLQTRSWTTPAGEARQTTEIVIDDMRVLDRRPEELGELPERLPVGAPGVGPVEPTVAKLGTGEASQPDLQPLEAPSTAGHQSTGDQTPTAKKSQKESQTSQKKKATKGKSSDLAEPKTQSDSQEESTEDLISNLPF